MMYAHIGIKVIDALIYWLFSKCINKNTFMYKIKMIQLLLCCYTLLIMKGRVEPITLAMKIAVVSPTKNLTLILVRMFTYNFHS
jgi:hypothetical protein